MLRIYKVGEEKFFDPDLLRPETVKIVHKEERASLHSGLKLAEQYFLCFVWTGENWAKLSRRSMASLDLPTFYLGGDAWRYMDHIISAMQKRAEAIPPPVFNWWYYRDEALWYARFSDMGHKREETVRRLFR